jgi:plastocyanin
MRAARLVGLTLLVAALGLALPALVAAGDPSAKMIESGGKYAFSPTSLSVTVGSTVTWTNTTDAPHTVTNAGGEFSSAVIEPGKTFSHTFATAGTFAYACTIHAYMRATVIVTAAAGTPAATAAPTAAPSGPATTVPPTDTDPFGTATSRSEGLPLLLLLAGGLAIFGAGVLRVWQRRRPE